jgi:hypothetical protein
LGRKILGFLIKSLPKIAENRVQKAYSVYKKAPKAVKTEAKLNLLRRIRNALELI